MKINIETIPHKDHRYSTCGDYWEAEGVLEVRVSQMSDWRYEVLVIVHELVEWFICKHLRIEEPDIKVFDEKYEQEREQGLHKPDDEPGFDSKCPCRFGHTFANGIECALAAVLGVDWNKYGDEVASL